MAQTSEAENTKKQTKRRPPPLDIPSGSQFAISSTPQLELPTTPPRKEPRLKWLSCTPAELKNRVKEDETGSIGEEFSQLNRYEEAECSAFLNHLDENRYSRVKCVEATRVKLKSGDDYIHANRVKGYNNDVYIMTQGPLDSTREKFWQMVCQENVCIIVMLTELKEAPPSTEMEKAAELVEKCSVYYPQTKCETQVYNATCVTCVSVVKKNGFVYSKLRVVHNCKVHNVQHLQFTEWKDFQLPNEDRILDFLQEVNSRWSSSDCHGTPLLVHCSAGINRSGVFVTVDFAIKQLKDKGEVNVYEIVDNLRKQRRDSVLTFGYYKCCYSVIVKHIEREETKKNKKTTTMTPKQK